MSDLADSPPERTPPPISPNVLRRRDRLSLNAFPKAPPPPTDALRAADVVLPGPDGCANCGAERTGAYCQACGQRHRDGRLTLRRLVRNFVNRFLDLESGLLHTAWRLTVAPGTVSRDVVAGRRQRYAGPVTYLVVVAALSVLLLTLFEGAYTGYFQEMLRPLMEREEGVLAGKDPEVVASTLVRWTNQGTIYFSIFIALVFATLGRWIVPGWAPRYNFAESCVFALYTTAHGFLYLLPLNLLVLAGPRFVFLVSGLGMLVMAVYVAVASRAFIQPRWATTALSFVAFAASYLLFSFVGGVIGFVFAFLAGRS